MQSHQGDVVMFRIPGEVLEGVRRLAQVGWAGGREGRWRWGGVGRGSTSLPRALLPCCLAACAVPSPIGPPSCLVTHPPVTAALPHSAAHAALPWHLSLQAQGATLFMVLLGAFQAQLGRYSGLERFAVGCPSGGRGQRVLEGMVGYLVNPLAMVADLRGDPSFLDFLARWVRVGRGVVG